MRNPIRSDFQTKVYTCILKSRKRTVSPSESKRETVLLQTAIFWIETPIKRQLTRCLLDGGSQRRFVCEDISRDSEITYIWLW